MRNKTLKTIKCFGTGSYPTVVVWNIDLHHDNDDEPYISGELLLSQIGDTGSFSVYTHGDDLKNVDFLITQLTAFKASIIKEHEKRCQV